MGQLEGSWVATASSAGRAFSSEGSESSGSRQKEGQEERSESSTPLATADFDSAPPGARFTALYLLSHTGDEAKPFKAIKYQNCTRTAFTAALRGIGVQQLINITDIPETFSASHDTEALPSTSLEDAPLKDGGRFLPVYASTDIGAQVEALQGWQRAITHGDEGKAGEWAVSALFDSGHANVQRYCGPKQILGPFWNKLERSASKGSAFVQISDQGGPEDVRHRRGCTRGSLCGDRRGSSDAGSRQGISAVQHAGPNRVLGRLRPPAPHSVSWEAAAWGPAGAAHHQRQA
ncbi:hypothetical protein WJX73_004546 [Symbiochloris irregularis]|uniref:Uncharacterized protein n=1 Tax=Symbiochloris irregularis TaxID=706552 RepID=A0AAW1PLS1_9CHLO